MYSAGRPYLTPINKYDMVKIYSYCYDDIYDAVDEFEFLYLCNIVLVATLITNTSLTIPKSDSDSEGE